MSGSVIVLVTDLDDPKHGEISVLESPVKAARLVETLLEAGFAQERIRVFHGAEMQAQVTYRPVVALSGEVAELAGEPAEDAKGSKDGGEGTEGESEAEGESANEEPGVKDGVKFSSLFRSA